MFRNSNLLWNPRAYMTMQQHRSGFRKHFNDPHVTKMRFCQPSLKKIVTERKKIGKQIASLHSKQPLVGTLTGAIPDFKRSSPLKSIQQRPNGHLCNYSATGLKSLLNHFKCRHATEKERDYRQPDRCSWVQIGPENGELGHNAHIKSFQLTHLDRDVAL